MTRKDIDNILQVICPNDEDYEKAIISPAYLEKELEALALEQEPCEDAISRQAAIDVLSKWLHGVFGIKESDGTITIFKRLRDLPSVSPARPKGKLILLENCSNDGYYCNQCNKKIAKAGWSNTVKEIKFCPNCGTRIERKEK